jgi:hypothetical protein
LINKQELGAEVHIEGTLAFHRSQGNNARVLSSKGPTFLYWIEENSYYNLLGALYYYKDITETKNCRA